MINYNFGAGPAMMPAPVIAHIQAEMPALPHQGMSILELSHRSEAFTQILTEAKRSLRELMAIPDDYTILFMPGGGTGQFAAAPLNLATDHHRIALLDSGHWAAAARDEAQTLGVAVETVASTAATQYHTLPQLPADFAGEDVDYLHICTNNTIEGTAYHEVPKTTLPIVADMSSNILAEPYRVQDFDVIFAGAQKNLGPAGMAVVIIKNSRLNAVTGVPSVLNYQRFAQADSRYNTPPVFNIYATGLVLKWVQDLGGVAEMYARNQEKSRLLYDFIDQSQLFSNPVAKADRSLTNIPFMTKSAELDAEVIAAATEQGLLNLKGHRSVGGMRASLYNAMPLAGVEALVAFLATFEQQHKEA